MPSEERRVPVGVGAVVLSGGAILLGKRKGSHGAGTWALPGGWLEQEESFETCAKRELEEETGIAEAVLPGAEVLPFVANNFGPAMEGKCSVTIFTRVRVAGRPAPENREPHKCHEWRWHDLAQPFPEPVFAPLQSFIDSPAWKTAVLSSDDAQYYSEEEERS
mmetsp:Transcript_17866/g.54647  ORF Transcript_17866/g.54647 Transcript_17866/m.54647 type:complete len:163 (-) Transcript_17866:1329-1817(-)